MNKWTKGLSMATLCLSLLGCGGEEATTTKVERNNVEVSSTEILPEDGAELIVWGNELGDKEFYELAGKKFEEKYGVTVKHEEVSILDSVKLLIQGGGVVRVGDVVSMPHDKIGDALTAGVIMENLVSGDRIKDDFIDVAYKASVGADGNLYGFPYTFETLVMVYNKDIMDQPNTFEEILEHSKIFNDPEEYQYSLSWGITNYYVASSFMSMYDGYTFGNNGFDADDIGIDKPETIKGIEEMLKLRPATVEDTEDIPNSQVAEGLFFEELVGAYITGPWSFEALSEDEDLNIGVTTLPTINGTKLNPFSTVKIHAVSAFTEYPKAAQLFAEFITSEEMLTERYRSSKTAPVHKVVAGLDEVKSNELISVVSEQGMNSAPMPSIPEIGYMWDPISAALSEIWNKGADVESEMKRAAQVIRDQIEMNKN